jgi:UDP-glucose 4-epimerase
VYGNPNSLPVKETSPMAPISPYGAHKLQCELICREFHDIFGVSTSSLRIFSAYGPGLQRQVMWDLCRQAITCREIKAQGTGRESRDFVHVSDICNAIDVVASTAPLCGEVYNLGSGTETTIAGLGSMIIQALGGPCAVSFDGFVPPGTPLNWRADISALRDLGFQPSVEIDQGVAAYAAWCRSVIE